MPGCSDILQSGSDHYICVSDLLYILHNVWRLNVLFHQFYCERLEMLENECLRDGSIKRRNV